MTDTPPEGWPTPEGETLVSSRETLVGVPPPPPAAPLPPPEGGPGDRRVGAGMLLALGVLALIVLGGLLAYLLTHRSKNDRQTTTVVVTTAANTAPKVAVPRLVGMKEQEALVRLGQVGLRPKEVFKATSKAKDVVVSQSPQEATELKRGAQVTLVIDSGAPKVALPDLTGMSFTDAQAKLDQLGLDSTKTEVTSTQPAGTVVDQAPKPNAKLAKGSTVTLSVAKAPAQATTASTTTTTATTTPTTTASSTTPAQPQNATVPDVTGQTESAAVQAMGQAGILASLFFVPSTDTLGTVEQQAKPSGTTVPFHSHVQINVSSGPGDKPKEQVPNVVGRTLQQAVSAMQGAHLRLIYLKYPVTSRAQAGKIVQQSPLGGGSAPQNAQVLVFVGAFQQ